MQKNLEKLFAPQSVCVIGASRSPEKVGQIILKNIIESKFAGKIYPINPKTDSINDLKCYPDVNSLPECPDLAIVAIPANLIVDELKQIGEKGIKNIVVVTAGFKETGEEGAKLEKELVVIAQKYDMNLLGPNCMGFVNNFASINTTFGQGVNNQGQLRFVSQSGAIAASIFDWCSSTGLGFSEFITLGNKAVIDETDILRYFLAEIEKNPQSRAPIGLYLESISNGSEFLKVAGQIAKSNPIFIIKPGKTEAAAKAMQSHTGAIAGVDAVLDTAFEQVGILRCETLEEFFDVAKAFAWEKAPEGSRVAVVSNAGGPAVICADAITKEGLRLSEFDEKTKTELLNALPRFASVINPVDILGDALADRYAAAAEIILKTKEVDALVFILTPQVMTQIEKTAELIGNLKKYDVPIFCAFMGGALIAQGEKKLNEGKIPVFRFPERAIATIGAMWKWKKHQQSYANAEEMIFPDLDIENKQTREIIDGASKTSRKTLDNLEANDILASCGIATPATEIVTDLNQAINFAETHSWPVVLKFSSPGLLHKKEIGGVVADISNNWQLEIVWDSFQRKIATMEPEIKSQIKVQIQKEILNGVEIIVGAKRDPVFGPVLLFGAGGTYAELIADRNLHLLPINIDGARELVERSKVVKILKGYRGEPEYQLDKLYDTIVRIGKIMELNPEIDEIEINPLIITLNHVWAVDGKVVLKTGITKPVVGPKLKIATTIKHEILAAKFHYFVFETEGPITYKPGQYVSVKVSNQRVNCYSIATHEGPNRFGLLIDTKPGGVGSKFFENVKEGDKITYLGPFGMFVLKQDDGKQIIMLGTGSGIAPIRRMTDELLKVQKTSSPIQLYFGLRYNSDIFWDDYFKKLSEEFPNFKYKLVLSKPDVGWSGLSGHITDYLKQDFPNASTCCAYMCGNKHMIDESQSLLLELGCPKDKICSEKF